MLISRAGRDAFHRRGNPSPKKNPRAFIRLRSASGCNKIEMPVLVARGASWSRCVAGRQASLVLARQSWRRTAPAIADYIAAICAALFRSAPTEKRFGRNVKAMTKMMIDMGIQPSGNVDRDFVSMMVPHHQGAIEMAQAQLRYGHNEQLKRLAQEIIVTQQQEIAAMRLAVGQPMAPSVLSPNEASGIQQMGSAYISHTGIVQEP